MKYWLTFNEISSVLHEFFMSGAINSPKEQLSPSDLFQATYHELVASALATRIAHEAILDAKVGCMILVLPTYPLLPDPADIVAMIKADHRNLFFGDVHAAVPIRGTCCATSVMKASNWISGTRTRSCSSTPPWTSCLSATT